MLKLRKYGTGTQKVILLHGGPGAPGYLEPVAQELSTDFTVFEPFQRGHHDAPLSVKTHVDDLHAFILAYCDESRPVLVGHSWGAMLALAYACEYVGSAQSLVLIGCGTFSIPARQEFSRIVEERTSASLKAKMERCRKEIADPNERMRALGRLFYKVYSYDAFTDGNDFEGFDMLAFEETWKDMLVQQKQGVYPGEFVNIDIPVSMLHGDFDPHPGRMIYSDLKPFIPQLEYTGFEKCGHTPWFERYVHTDFYDVLRRVIGA